MAAMLFQGQFMADKSKKIKNKKKKRGKGGAKNVGVQLHLLTRAKDKPKSSMPLRSHSEVYATKYEKS